MHERSWKLESEKWVASEICLKQSYEKQWPGRIFKIPAPMEWFVIVTNPQFVEDMRKAPDHVLSAHEANNEVQAASFRERIEADGQHIQTIQTDYTIGPHIGDNPYHVHIVRNQLKRALPNLTPEVYEEMVDAFSELIPVTEGNNGLRR